MAVLAYAFATIAGTTGLMLFALGVASGSTGTIAAGGVVCAIIPFWVLVYRRGLQQRDVVALVIPVFLVYQLLSVLLANTSTSGVQAALVIAASASFAVGAFVGHLPRRESMARGRPSVLDVRGRLFLATLGVGTLTAGYLYSQYGIAVLSTSIAESRLAAFDNGYLGTIVVTALSVALILAATSAIEAPGFRAKLPWSIAAALSLVLIYGFGNRGMYVIPILTILAYQIVRYPRRLVGVVLAGVGLIIVVALAGYTRDLQLFGSAHNSSLERAGIPADWTWLGPVISYFRGTSQAVDLVIQTFPAVAPHPAGATFFSAILAPLPGEQLSAGVYLKNVLGLDFVGTGLASGAIGGFYQDFGVVGVVVGFFVLGVLGRFAQDASWRNPRNLMFFAYLLSHFWFINYAHPLPFFTTITIPLFLFALQRPGEETTFSLDHPTVRMLRT